MNAAAVRLVSPHDRAADKGAAGMRPVTRHRQIVRRLSVLFVAAALVVGVAACGDDDEVDATATTQGGGAASGSDDDGGGLYGGGESGGGSASGGEVTSVDFAFPDTVEADAGAIVTFKNDDDAEHTVTADDGDFDTEVPGGETAEITAPDEPGEYSFHCEIHPNMTSTLVVT
jgi:plastocyanin